MQSRKIPRRRKESETFQCESCHIKIVNPVIGFFLFLFEDATRKLVPLLNSEELPFDPCLNPESYAAHFIGQSFTHDQINRLQYRLK